MILAVGSDTVLDEVGIQVVIQSAEGGRKSAAASAQTDDDYCVTPTLPQDGVELRLAERVRVAFRDLEVIVPDVQSIDTRKWPRAADHSVLLVFVLDHYDWQLLLPEPSDRLVDCADASLDGFLQILVLIQPSILDVYDEQSWFHVNTDSLLVHVPLSCEHVVDNGIRLPVFAVMSLMAADKGQENNYLPEKHQGAVDTLKPALLVQDIQNFWLYEPDSNQNLKRSVEKRLDIINSAIAWFRKKELPVIVGYTVNQDEGLVPESRSFEVPESVHVKKTDPWVTKLHASAFANPELGAILKREGCDTMLIVGLSASGCVLATYFDAPDWDIHAYLVKGGVASAEERHVIFAEEICDTLSLEDLDAKFLSSR